MASADLKLRLSAETPEELQDAIDSLDSLIEIFCDVYGRKPLAVSWQFYKLEPPKHQDTPGASG